MDHPKQKGEVGVAMIMAALIGAGECVLTPFGDNQRYDLVLDRAGTFYRVQCKSGLIVEGTVEFPTCSSANHTRNGTKRTYFGEVEFFGVYCPANGAVYLVPIEDVSNCNHVARLRLEATKNNQSARVRLAEQYRVGEFKGS